MNDPDTFAMTKWQADQAGPQEIATTVNADAFFLHYFGMFE